MVQITLAGLAIAQTDAPKSIIEHFDLIWVILVAAIGAITWFAVRSLNSITDRLNNHGDRLNSIEKSHEHLMGLHEATCGTLMRSFEEFKHLVYPIIERRKEPRE